MNISGTKGITLVELLVAAAIFVAILAIIMAGLRGSTQAVGTVLNETELLEDLRASGQVMTDSLSKAVYIYPPGAEISLNKNATWSVTNPLLQSNTWRIGQDPIIAFIQAPDNPLLGQDRCASNTDACLKFVAYYALSREAVLKGINEKYRPFLTDPNNSEGWMLFEYRRNLSIGVLDEVNSPPKNSSDGLVDGRASLVIDKIKPLSGFVPFAKVACRDEGAFDEECNDMTLLPETPFHFLETVALGEFQLELEYKQRGKTYTSPVLRFPIAPKNLYAE